MTRGTYLATVVAALAAAVPSTNTSQGAVAPATPQAGVEARRGADVALPPTLEQLNDALRTPVITGSLPTPPMLKVGRAEIQPGPGAKLLVMSAGGRPCGWLLDGPATMTYRVEDRYSIPVARRNAKAAGGLDVGVDGGVLLIRAKVPGVATWTWDVDTSDARPVQGGDAALPSWVRKFVDTKQMAQPEIDMLLAARNGETGLAWVVVQGSDGVVMHGSDDLALHVDPAPSQRIEVLWRMRKARSPYRDSPGDQLFATELAAQPIDRTWLDSPELPFVSTETEADVSDPTGRMLRVSARTRVRLLRDRGTVLPMLLMENVRVDEKRHPYRITKLTADGTAVDWLQRGGYLLVALPRPMRRDETVTLDVAAELDLGSKAPGPYDHWRLLGDWYPKPMPNAREHAEIAVAAALKAPLVPLAGGDLQERATADGINTVRTRLPGPMELGVVVGGRYNTVKIERAGMHVYLSTLEHKAHSDVDKPGTVAIAVRQCLERWLGVPYPFPDLQIIETGTEPDQAPGVIFLPHDDLVLTRPLGQTGTMHRIAREVAHGWFGHVAKIPTPEESWLGESLADYTSAYCLSQIGRNPAEMFKTRLGEWKAASRNAGDDVSVLLAEHLGNSDEDKLARAQLLNGRGPLVLHGVRTRLVERYGEEKGTSMFLVWIRSYIKNFTYKTASTRGLIAILEQITGESWQAYFEQYLFGTDPFPVK